VVVEENKQVADAIKEFRNWKGPEKDPYIHVWRVCHFPVNGTATNPWGLFNGFRLENGVNTYLKKDDADEDANTYIYDECKPQGVGVYESDLERYEQIEKVAQISTGEETTECVMYPNHRSPIVKIAFVEKIAVEKNAVYEGDEKIRGGVQPRDRTMFMLRKYACILAVPQC
jgi:hypothetical protein